MKVSKVFLTVVGGLIIVAAFVYVYMARSQATAQQTQVNTQIAQAEANLPKVTADRQLLQNQVNAATDKLTQLQNQLADAQLQLKNTLKPIPSTADSIKYDEKLFALATAWNLQVVDLTTDDPKDVVIGGLTYSVSSYKMNVQGQDLATLNPPVQTADDYAAYISGTMDDIMHFINAVATDTTGDFTNATVKIMTITAPQPLTQADIDAGTTPKDVPSANIEISIYAYKGV